MEVRVKFEKEKKVLKLMIIIILVIGLCYVLIFILVFILGGLMCFGLFILGSFFYYVFVLLMIFNLFFNLVIYIVWKK